MTNFPHLATRLFNVPIAIAPQKAEIVMAALADRFGIAKFFRPDGHVIQLAGGGAQAFLEDMDADAEPAQWKPYEVCEGIAIIPVQGTLVQKLGTLRPYSGMTGYDGIRALLSLAMEDSAVRAIVLDIDSPGGEVAGCFDLTDAIYRARGAKPIWAVLTESAYSAAYAIASAADRIIVPRTGGTGSVGVICMHVDFSQALTSAGISVTLIHYGSRKADGNEYAPLPKDVLARVQSDVDEMGELFVATVARNRNLSAARVRNTQAGTFLGAAGVEVGFADEVLAPDEALASLLDELG
ncbi:S49 family peptidase [Paraburkholderia caballeronis]|uniref:Signal peptide peptidase SppA n=1 Tax=Paraburkholderia caballeronis TaxID=416943 RepID=A0A1H7TZF7_9BURK|nr:S49 family peptidase [Paraburkholderia caballeronis]PXW23401.1 protein C [Paraburkholderia caballeronis]PXW98394.1 protein C [Paraburkholderia caballeronis]RAJ95125.1 protein C [Paraburkholderia caballeronis]SEC55691.1 protein C Serine peptidase. MEROPS family S49 [Paraburkholderia caballeronis]SEL89818.1 signal peptide peptidase SppA [Paraburkholderia caballeronis]